MKLIKKADVRLVDGYLLDTDGELIVNNKLAEELNELEEIKDLLSFLDANKEDIEAELKPVVFHPTRYDKRPVLRSKTEVPTPLRDAEIEHAKALAEEFLDFQVGKDINDHLLHYSEVAKWLAEEYILVGTGATAQVAPNRINRKDLDFTEAEVVGIVEAYHDPETSHLRSRVTIDFS